MEGLKAMIIDVSSILKEIGGRIELDGDVRLPDTEFLGDYHFEEPLKVSGSVSNNGKSLILRARAEGSMITNCARCMKEITVPVSFSIDENLAREDADISEDEDIILFSDTTIEIDDIILDNFLMSTDGKYLCKDDCKGLCPECGKDLNEGDCDCNKENIDPRWAALLDIMKDKED